VYSSALVFGKMKNICVYKGFKLKKSLAVVKRMMFAVRIPVEN
jgi:hypothetical protein